MGEKQDQQLEDQAVMSGLEIDTIGEILNISMGSAATAISKMLDRQVAISTPTVEIRQFHSLDYAALEPAMLVKINYIEGITGSNMMIFRQRDMQVILNLLMGNDDPPRDDFVFDELSMSAAGEVMNQMMGVSATALAEFLGRPINISTPEAFIVEGDKTYQDALNIEEGSEIVAVSFRLTINDVMDSSFASIMTIPLTKEIVSTVMGQQEEEMKKIQPQAVPAQAAPVAEPTPAPAPEPAVTPEPPTAPAASAPAQPAAEQAPPQPAAQPAPAPQQGQPPYQQATPGYPPQGQQGYQPYPPYGYGYGYPPMPYPPYQQGYAPQEADAYQQQAPRQNPVNVKNTQFPVFMPQTSATPDAGGNMDLLMGVSLDVSVEIGKAKRKIREIVEFGQGTVIELNKQAGAPVDIVVNGRLLARGDVVVIDDNFGVRITEILGTKELMESLKEEAL
ncbi:MAG: flagellar motor switch protein FliN [Clostridiales bacterium]|nr:flagellar motor switch protein FliN [Clostridiales bacterium]